MLEKNCFLNKQTSVKLTCLDHTDKSSFIFFVIQLKTLRARI